MRTKTTREQLEILASELKRDGEYYLALEREENGIFFNLVKKSNSCCIVFYDEGVYKVYEPNGVKFYLVDDDELFNYVQGMEELDEE